DEEIGDAPDEGHRREEDPASPCHRITLAGDAPALLSRALHPTFGYSFGSVRILLSRTTFCRSSSCFSGRCVCLTSSGRVARPNLESSRLTRCSSSLSRWSSPGSTGGAALGPAFGVGRGEDLRVVRDLSLIR